MFVSVSSAADTLTPAQALTQRMVALDGMRAAIVQKIYANGVVLEESQGSVALAKPNLRWQVDTPFPQVILVKRDELQIYDEDLAQLTIRDLSAAVSETPADVLMQPERLLSGDYTVTLDRVEAREVYRLFSDASSALFQRLDIVFAEDTLESLTILDWQSQQTQILFVDVEILSELPASLFELSLPQDTDVVRG
jgi:outer membrane lipoprotein carrier protein